MRKLTVLYDYRCGVCRRCKDWLKRQPQFIELELLAAESLEAQQRFPTLACGEPEELIAVSDEGGVYRGDAAWLMCLYALKEYREWSARLAAPELRPLARAAFKFLSSHRHRLSHWLGWSNRQTLETLLNGRADAKCEDGSCERS